MCGNCSVPSADPNKPPTPASNCQCGKGDADPACACDFTDKNGASQTPAPCGACNHIPTYTS